MKFILNEDNLTIEKENNEKFNSGSVKYYEADVEYDENWNNLIIKAVLVPKDEDTGKSISLINNKIFIDNEIKGPYEIGFIGYKIENDEKIYQISTNLKAVSFNKGAGQIETEESVIPTPTEWEIYIAQIQEITSQISGLGDDLEAEVNHVIEQLENGDFDGADGQDGQDGADGITPTIGQNGNWYLGDVDTGKPSRGEKGTDGKDGKDGINRNQSE